MKLNRRPLPLFLGTAGIASAAAIAIGGVQVTRHESAASTSATSVTQLTNPYTGGYQGRRSWSAAPPVGGTGSTDASGSVGSPDGTPTGGATGSVGATGTTTEATTEATASQLVGVVDIVTTVNYGEGEAAGTGMVLTPSGEVLTNNHVVEGATGIRVTVLSTGRTYPASVVGTSPTNDVAVLQLEDASGLSTVALGDSSSLQVGDAVTGVGNAGNETGTSAASGQVTALDQDITASDGSGSSSEDLTGLIMTSAAIEAGDSGGPLYDAQGQVVGIDTAAETGGRSGQTIAGYAIPIDTALSVAEQIRSGADNATIHQGVPAFLGIQVAQAATRELGQGDDAFGSTASPSAGAEVSGVVSGSAAERAGITAGSTITAVGGDAVASAADLTGALANQDPGDRVSVAWVDATGATHTATVTLGSGPAD